MAGKPTEQTEKKKRDERLARQLRANLTRRKAQARARRDSDGNAAEPDGPDINLKTRSPAG